MKIKDSLYSLSEYADWNNWFPRKFWKRLLKYFDDRNPNIKNSSTACSNVCTLPPVQNK